MAKAKEGTAFVPRPKKKRKGVHAKNKNSKSKNATNYKKVSIGQG